MGWLALILLLGGLLGLAVFLCACKVSGDCSRMEEQNGGSMFVKDNHDSEI